MQFQSAEHEQSYRNACRALAHARREAYYQAAAMTTAQLRTCEPDYRRATGAGFDLGGEALVQLRMVRTVMAHRTRSPARSWQQSVNARTRKAR